MFETLRSPQGLHKIHTETMKIELTNEANLVWGAETRLTVFNGIWCSGEEATESEKQWAEIVGPFTVTEQVEGANGLLSICDGEMA